MVIINLLLLLALHVITIVGYVLMRKWLPFTKFKYQQGACLLNMGCVKVEGQRVVGFGGFWYLFFLTRQSFLHTNNFFFLMQDVNFQSLRQGKTWGF